MTGPQERGLFRLEIRDCNCADFCPLAHGRVCPMTETPQVTIYYRSDDEGGIHPDVNMANHAMRRALKEVGLTGTGSDSIPQTVGERLIELEEDVLLGCNRFNAPAGTVHVSAKRQRTSGRR